MQLNTFGLEVHPQFMKQSKINLDYVQQTYSTLSSLATLKKKLILEENASDDPFYELSEEQTSPKKSQGFSISPQKRKPDEISLVRKNQSHNQKHSERVTKVDASIQKLDAIFQKSHRNMISQTFLFVKSSLNDVQGKFMTHRSTWDRSSDKKVYLNIDKNLFLKAENLEDFKDKAKLYFTELSERYPFPERLLINPEQDFAQIATSQVKKQIEEDYAERSNIPNTRALKQLRNLVQITAVRPLVNVRVLIFWLATVVLMLTAIAFLIVYFDINFDTNNDFEDTFPIWRGLWHCIYLIWIFGINTSIFNYFKVNFNLLTAFNNFHFPNPSLTFICAAMFTSAHLCLFLVYLIHLAEIGNIRFKEVPEEYLPGVSWLLFILFFILPVRRMHYHCRMYPLMMAGRTLLSPILGTQFKFHWFTEVFVSFRQPIRDMLYTFTYYFIDNTVVYWNTIIFETITGVCFYWMRIIQNARQMHQNRLFGGMPYYGSIKCFLNSITMITSYLSRKEQSQDLLFLCIWVVTAAVSTSYAYHFDLKYDWGLLDPKYGYLRKKLIYNSKKLYYGIILLNLLLRFAWTLNVSPDIIRRIPVKPYLIVMLLTTLEITRRGIWMIFRVEKQHIVVEDQLNKLYHTESLRANPKMHRGENTQTDFEQLSASNRQYSSQLQIQKSDYPEWFEVTAENSVQEGTDLYEESPQSQNQLKQMNDVIKRSNLLIQEIQLTTLGIDKK